MPRSITTFAFLLFAGLASCGRPEERLVVYTAAEAEPLKAYGDSFRRAHPEIRLVWVRDSTGVVASKLIAEARRPRADVVFGLAVTAMDQVDRSGLLQPYAPKGVNHIDPKFKDPRNPPHYVGTALFTAVVCVNRRLLRDRGLPNPQRWEDLTQPAFRGQIEMPDPASSGTGLIAVSGWLQSMGEKEGWRYMERLHPNISAYAHSGSKPCRDAARGEVAVGVGLDGRAAVARTEGLPLDIVTPVGGVGWDYEAAGLIRGGRHPTAARAFLDWALSPEATPIYAKYFAVTAGPGRFPTAPGFPPDLARHLAPMTIAWTSENRSRVIREWSRRFGGKADGAR